MGKTYKIAVLPGDGTGPEVTAEAVKVAEVAAEKFGFKLDLTDFDFGGDRYLATGEVLPESGLAELRKMDAILLGAVGHPDVRPGILETGLLLKLRFSLDQYINLRPVKLFQGVDCPLKDKGPEHIDFVVVRENTEGLYSGMGGSQYKGTPHEVATQIMCNTRHGVERCCRYAFDVTRRRARKRQVSVEKRDIKSISGKVGEEVTFDHRERGPMNVKYVGDKEDRSQFEVAGMLTLCAKTNVLTHAHDLWWRAFNEVGAADYPEVFRDYAHVDATCMWMVKNPEWFDVIVVCNMFGDIITDLGAMIQGGMGIAAGGNINPAGVSMFEPIGGSAPKYTGKGVINPLAAICAGQMMLDVLGEEAAADAIEKAVMEITGTKLKSMQAGRMGYSTSQVGDLVAELV